MKVTLYDKYGQPHVLDDAEGKTPAKSTRAFGVQHHTWAGDACRNTKCVLHHPEAKP